MSKLHKLQLQARYYNDLNNYIKTFDIRSTNYNIETGDLIQYEIIKGNETNLDDNFYKVMYCEKYGDQVVFSIKKLH